MCRSMLPTKRQQLYELWKSDNTEAEGASEGKRIVAHLGDRLHLHLPRHVLRLHRDQNLVEDERWV